MDLVNLEAATRYHMVHEINRDVASDTLYISPRLSELGRRDYPKLLLDAAESGDADSLAVKLQTSGRLNLTETATRNGKTYSKRVPTNAHQTMAEGEFNRFYARGLCLRAAEEGIEEVIIYRAKGVTNPRPESESIIGTAISVTQLLANAVELEFSDLSFHISTGGHAEICG